MKLEDFYNKYIFKQGKKEFKQLTKKEKFEIQSIFRMWEKKLIHLKERSEEI